MLKLMNNPGNPHVLYAFVPIFREQERSFWQRVADSLASRYSIHLVVSGRAVKRYYTDGKNFSALPLGHSGINFSRPSALRSSIDFQTIVNRTQKQASLWSEVYSSNEQFIHASLIALHLSALSPIAVLIWNWHRPEGLLARSIAESMGIQCWDIERTPWPGMLTLDKIGQLSETRLAASMRVLCDKHPILEASSCNSLQMYIDRANEYISAIKSDSYTWWQQPSSGAYVADYIRHHNDYITSSFKILFAGQVDNDVQNFLFSPHYESNIDAFVSVLNSLPDGTFVVGKHHPMSRVPVSAYQHALDNAQHVTGVWVKDLDVASSLSLVDHVIAANSSLLFEALCEGKSCFELGTTMLSGMNILYDCASNHNLEVAISDWLSSPLSDCKRRALRFRVLTGFALSHGLLSFENYSFSFNDAHCNIYMPKWLEQVLACKTLNLSDFQGDSRSFASGIPARALAMEGLLNYTSSVDALESQLSLEKATGIKKAILSLLEAIRKSVSHHVRWLT